MTSRPRIDWNAVRGRLARAQSKIEQAFAPPPDETRRILKGRAAALAATPAVNATGDALELVDFALAQEMWGVESAYVREIGPLVDLTPLPCTPPFVLGIMNLRGEIVSVLDIRQFFDLPARGLTDLNRVIVLRSGEMTFGILADTILGVSHTPLADIQPAPPALAGIRERYLKGVTRDRKVVLDAVKLLHDERIVVRQHVDREEGRNALA